MNIILNNKWNLGKANFGIHKVPKAYEDYNGIYAIYASLDKSIGTEVVLYIRDETDFIYKLAKQKPFKLFLKPGVVNTTYGPLLFLLFWVPDSVVKNRVYVEFDVHLNPLQPEHLAVFYDLSRQSHWHLFLINKENEQIEFFEFENNYGLYESLIFLEEACSSKVSIDFLKAKKEFMSKYSLKELFLM